MSALGPHEQQLRALREKKAARAARRPTTPPAAPAYYKEPVMKTDQPTNISMGEMRGDDLRKAPAKIKPPKKAAKKAKKKPAKKAKKKADKDPARDGLRPGSKLATIDGMLRHPGGCTRAEVMKACDWPSVSMQQQAAALGVELKSSKEKGEPTRYWID